MARNPDTYGNLLSSMILGIAFSEAIAIYCLVISFLMLFKVV
jgi:F0F1-type ATP synthase membrane subunit c/vacuolar-type H+-ATPase subunit K